jgi:hypothetical protein
MNFLKVLEGLLVLFLLFTVQQTSLAQSFTNIDADLDSVRYAGVAWGDYDNDGDLDVVLSGSNYTYIVTRVYQNQNGAFSDISAGLEGLDSGELAWGDYDNDNDLDLICTGLNASSVRVTKIYHNDNGSFTDIAAGLTGVSSSAVDWGDYDNDGDLDVIISGTTDALNRIAKIYCNNDGTFTDIAAGITGVFRSSVDWGDYDNDGDLDLLVAGHTGSGGSFTTKIYENNDGNFTDIAAGLPGFYQCCGRWGDYDQDGDLDIVLCGYNGSDAAKIYHNNSGFFSSISAGLSGVNWGYAAWGDCDNDGDLDLLVTGSNTSKLYINSSGSFSALGAGLAGIDQGGAAWGDYDNDNDLDILLAGSSRAEIYRNDATTVNTAPTAPTALNANPTDPDSVSLSWSGAGDTETASSALTYQLCVGTTNDNTSVVSPMARLSDGYGKTPMFGGSFLNQSWFLKNLPADTYEYKVQTVDNALQRSAFASSLFSNAFVALSAGLDPLWASCAAWGDYDNDGDLDLLLCGRNAGGTAVSKVYQNSSGTFSDISAGLTGIWSGSVEWGDYDNDNDLDIALSGYDGSNPVSKIYRNDSGSFTDIGASILNLWGDDVSWGDYDNDGDLDLMLCGYDGTNPYSKLYRNDDNSFIDSGLSFTGLHAGCAAWCDYDNDGDVDIILTGRNSAGTPQSIIYRNDNHVFTDISASLFDVERSHAAWGDYDSDGDADLLLSGDTQSGYVTRLYRNDNGSFTDLSAGLTGICNGGGVWGDYDNDGDLDILLTGSRWATPKYLTKLYQNDSGSFREVSTALKELNYSCAAWGDIDNDHDLDLVLSGRDVDLYPFSQIYRNDQSTANTAPAAPAGLAHTSACDEVTLSWNASTDNQTASDGLSYHLRVGTTSGANDIVSSMAQNSDGWRKIAALGGQCYNLSWTLQNLAAGTYYWSVQAVDNALEGSAFAAESAFELDYVRLQAKLFLQGPYDQNLDRMRDDLRTAGPVPLTSPYTRDSRTIAAIPEQIVDWVLVQLRTTADGAAVVSKSALLHRDGRIVADDGSTGHINIAAAPASYYIVIRHRNHLSVMSSASHSLSANSSTLYDFSSSSGQTFGGRGAVELEDGVWGLWCGDLNQNGTVNSQDYTLWYNADHDGVCGYSACDCNEDGTVDASDFILWSENAKRGARTTVP